MAARTVTMIPPKAAEIMIPMRRENILKRVAAYSRVSTGDEEQLTSYEAQISYYTKYIKNHEGWVFVDMYADRDRTGTTTKGRDGFNRMIQDARDGKIDLIITKSISRFARNTVDTLSIVRELKAKGIGIYFEKENIDTLDAKGELFITIMSSLAQEESRSISENVKWGWERRFAEGKVSLPYKHFLGYEKGENGLPKVVESEARIVRLIYKMFLQGRSYNSMKSYLESKNIPSPGKKPVWSVTTIISILTNEKYKGDAVLRKKYCEDYLTHEMKVNNGERPKYFVENSHPAIIDRETFDMAQIEYVRRKEMTRQPSGTDCFAGKIVCGSCGSHYGGKRWHAGSKYERTVYLCNHKRDGEEVCTTPHYSPQTIMEAFVQAFNTVLMDKEQLAEDYELILDFLGDTEAAELEEAELNARCTMLLGKLRELISENASVAQNQEEYRQKYERLSSQFEQVRARLDELEREAQSRRARRSQIKSFLEGLLEQSTPLTEWDEELWYNTVNFVTAGEDGTLTFTFRDGSAVPVKA